jgi:hypothetical protein
VTPPAPSAAQPALTIQELTELAEHEAVIAANLTSFIDTGSRLIAIRDKRLYRASYPTFEAYVRGKWNISRQRAYQLISAGLLTTVVDIDIPNERVARQVLALPEPDRAPVLVLAHSASGGELDTGWILDASEVHQEIKATGGFVSDDEGETTAAVAAVTEHRAERLRRKKQYIREDKERQQGVSQDICYQGHMKILNVDPTSGDLLINAPELAQALSRGEIVTYIVYVKGSPS